MAGRADVEAGKAAVRIWVDNSKLVAGLNDFKKRMTSMGADVAKFGAGIAAAGAAITGPLVAAVKHFASTGDWLDKMAGRTSANVELLSELAFAAQQSGASINDVEVAMRHMQKKGHAVSQFQEMADSIAAIEDPTKRAQRAIEVWGKKAGIQLLPMVEGLADLREEARQLGIVPTEAGTKMAAALTDSFGRISSVTSALTFNLGEALGPTILKITEAFVAVLKRVNEFIQANGELIRIAFKVGAVLTIVGTAIAAIGGAMVLAGVAAAGFATALTVMTAVIAAIAKVAISPLGLIVISLTAATVAWVKFTESGQAAWQNIVDQAKRAFIFLKEVFTGIGDALMSGNWALAGQIAITALQVVLAKGVEAIANMIGGTLGDVFASVGSDLLEGDFTGAWETAITYIKSLWADFAKFIVNVFTAAANGVINSFQSMMDRVSVGLGAVSTLIPKGKAGDLLRTALGAVGVGASAASIGAGAIKSPLGAIDAAANVGAGAARGQLQGRVGGAREGMGGTIAALEEELARLRQQAADAREKAKLETGPGPEVDFGEAAKTKAFGTFSAAAAIAGGAAGGDPTVRELKESRKRLDKIEKIAARQAKAAEALNAKLGVTS